MKKVINITLGGIVFAIDEEAYSALSLYLEQIKSNLAEGEDIKEIIDDVEMAIAEKFIALNRSEKMAVITADVTAVISEMGSPVEFATDEAKAGTDKGEAQPKETAPEPKKRLYRDKDNAVVAGVSAGLANYFGIDPVIVRLIFVILTFLDGIGLIAYAILWLVVPQATTTADKYAMRGERVTLKDISERVKKNLDSLDQLDYTKTKSVWSGLRSILDKLFRVIGTVVAFGVLLLRYLAGIALIIFGALGIAGTVAAYSVILLSEKVMFGAEVERVFASLEGSPLGITALVSLFITIAIPLIFLIMAGASLLAKRSYFTVQKFVTTAVLWIVAGVLAATTTVLQVEQLIQHRGPVEGRFDDSSFEVEWQNGGVYI